MVNVSRLGEAKWTGKTTLMFVSFFVGLLLESYVFSLASIAIYWVQMPKSLGQLLLAWAPIWLIIGIIIAGPVADKLGRKITLYITLGFYAVGGLLLFFSSNYVVLLIALAFMLMAGGGEMNSIMVATHELMPRKHRGKAMMMEINAINLGGFILAVLAFTSAASSVVFQRDVVAVAVLLVVIALLATRTAMPESVLWLEKRGRHDEAVRQIKAYWGDDWEAALEPEPEIKLTSKIQGADRKTSILFRVIVVTLTAAANTVGFGLVAYTLAYYYFPHLQPVILAVFEGVGFIGGFVGLVADRVSRRRFLFWSFLGTFIITVLIGLTTPVWQHQMWLFWVLLVALAIVNSLCYLTEDTMKAEVWPTEVRGTWTAITRFISIGLYIPAIYLTSNMPVNTYFLFNAAVWLVGLLAATAWLVWGRETGQGLSIEAASGGTD
ncbi:MAG: MFS transporter [Thermaerobacter sp.]|nr:MFS transporter [Thermaerobacter sp.]